MHTCTDLPCTHFEDAYAIIEGQCLQEEIPIQNEKKDEDDEVQLRLSGHLYLHICLSVMCINDTTLCILDQLL